MAAFNARIEQIQEIMRQQKTDYLVLAPSAQMLYLTGLNTTADERLQAFVVPVEGTPVMVLPKTVRFNNFTRELIEV